MLVFVKKCARGSTLALMLLLAASANCLCVSYDTNENDDVPPVNVEFCLIRSGESMTAQMHAAEAVTVSNACGLNQSQDLPLTMQPEWDSATGSAASPQLVVPLRR